MEQTNKKTIHGQAVLPKGNEVYCMKSPLA